jgi:hypothetical protein
MWLFKPCPRNKLSEGEFHHHTPPHKTYRAVKSLPLRIAASYICMTVNKAASW